MIFGEIFPFQVLSSYPTTILSIYQDILYVSTDQLSCHDGFQMRLFFIRHGETEHNVAGLLAGVTDSLLTNHGLIQAQRLGSYLIKQRCLKFSQVFASDLKRASRTASEICQSQNVEHPALQIAPIQLALLREQDFGSFELQPWNQRKDSPSTNDADFKPKETKAAMKARADTFLDDSLLPLLALDDESEQVVGVISHGLFLGALWRALLLRFGPLTISFHPEVLPLGSRKPIEHLPSWSNTGYLELSLHSVSHSVNEQSVVEHKVTGSQTSITLNATMKVVAVNSKAHLTSLKRTRGGVGSSTSDDKQKRVDSFFKRSKLDNARPVSLKVSHYPKLFFPHA